MKLKFLALTVLLYISPSISQSSETNNWVLNDVMVQEIYTTEDALIIDLDKERSLIVFLCQEPIEILVDKRLRGGNQIRLSMKILFQDIPTVTFAREVLLMVPSEEKSSSLNNLIQKIKSRYCPNFS
ncbi:MAG: hypothetical protein Q7S73_02910 [bacterium]|nr:hypothetical protein [bacterium]